MFVNFQHPRNQPGLDDDSDDGEDVLDPESGSKNPQFQVTCQIYPLYLLLQEWKFYLQPKNTRLERFLILSISLLPTI